MNFFGSSAPVAADPAFQTVNPLRMGAGPAASARDGFPSHADWLNQTSVFLSRRSDDLRRLDAAYEKWRESPSDDMAKGRLFNELDRYLREKGGRWEGVTRNTASNGLLKRVYEHLEPRRGTLAMGLNAVASTLVPESRFGVLFVLGQTDIEMNWLSFTLESVAAVGTAVGQGFAQAGAFSIPIDGVQHNSTVMGLSGQTLGGVAGAMKGPMARHQVAVVPVPIGGAASRIAGAGGPPLHIPDDPDAALSTFERIGGALAHFARQVQSAIWSLFTWLWEKVKSPLRSMRECAGAIHRTVGVETELKLAHTLVKQVIVQVLKASVPYVGALIEAGAGIVKALGAARESLMTWWARYGITIASGHPELMGRAIEHQMHMGMVHGLADALRGGISAAIQGFLHAPGALVGAILSGLNFLVKGIIRLVERFDIQRILSEMREVWGREQALHRAGVDSMQRYKVNLDPACGSIIHDKERFTRLFERACEASPLLPMIALNSGYAGNMWSYLDLSNSRPGTLLSDRQFASGTEYFHRLKLFSREYMRASGFRFSSTSPSVQAAIGHALGDAYKRPPSSTNKVLAFAQGF